jgi:hypothetical protein
MVVAPMARMKSLAPVSLLFAALMAIATFVAGCLPAAAQWVEDAPFDPEEWLGVGLLLPMPEDAIVAGSPLLPGMLDGLDAEQLRYLRNTVFARHGFDFGDQDLAEYFASRSWDYKADPEYSEARLTLVDQQNLEVLMKAEGDWEAAGRQAGVVVMQQTAEISKAVGYLEILDSYITDKVAVANGTAPEGFDLPSLDFYKETLVTSPLTAPAKEEIKADATAADR